MLDSVLVARDRYLRKGGVMAPSQTKIMLSGVDCAEYMQQRVGFWSDVYGQSALLVCRGPSRLPADNHAFLRLDRTGFDMRAMAEEINEDSLVEVLEASEVATSYSCIKVRFFTLSISSAVVVACADLVFVLPPAGHPHLDCDRQVARFHFLLLAHLDSRREDACFPRTLRHLLHPRRRFGRRRCSGRPDKARRDPQGRGQDRRQERDLFHHRRTFTLHIPPCSLPP